MEKSLTDVIKEALIGKKIKLYKVLDKCNSTKGLEYFVTQKDNLYHPKKCQIIGESHGFIKSIETETLEYDGDWYDIIVVDDNDSPVNVSGFNSITSKFEII